MSKVYFDIEEIQDAILDGATGFCVKCGAEANNVEPDARNYRCEECDEYSVFGAEELLVMGLVE